MCLQKPSSATVYCWVFKGKFLEIWGTSFSTWMRRFSKVMSLCPESLDLDGGCYSWSIFSSLKMESRRLHTKLYPRSIKLGQSSDLPLQIPDCSEHSTLRAHVVKSCQMQLITTLAPKEASKELKMKFIPYCLEGIGTVSVLFLRGKDTGHQVRNSTLLFGSSSPTQALMHRNYLKLFSGEDTILCSWPEDGVGRESNPACIQTQKLVQRLFSN